MNPGLTKTYKTGGAVAKRRIVKFASDFTVVQSAAAGDLHVGVSDMSADVASGDRCDVRRTGIVEVVAGGGVTRGQSATSDANGKAVNCIPAAGESARAIGVFEASGVDGDIVDLLLAPHVVTTPAAAE